MKKMLLLSVAAMATMGAFAQEDITPSNYYYNHFEGEFSYHPTGFTGANFSSPVWESVNGDAHYNNGLVAIAGGQFGNTSQPYFNDLKAGTQIVDLGGEVGKVLCISGVNSKINDKLAELYGDDAPEIKNCTGSLNWFNFNWFTNPANTPSESAASRITCRIVLNVYSNGVATDNVINTAYLVDNQGNVRPGSSGNNSHAQAPIKMDEFAVYEDEDRQIPEMDDNGDNIWDPNTWLVYEVEGDTPDNETGKNYNPLRLKMEMNQGNFAGCTMFIREVSFHADNEAAPVAGRNRSWLKLTPNPSKSGISEVIGGNDDVNAPVEYFNIQGQKVSNPEGGIFIRKQGSKVTKVVL